MQSMKLLLLCHHFSHTRLLCLILQLSWQVSSIYSAGGDRHRYRHLWATLWAVRSLQQRRLCRQGHLGWHPSWTWVVCTVLYCTVLYCTVLYWHPSWTRRVVCYVLRCDHRHLTSVTMQWCWLSSWLVISDSGRVNIVTKANILFAENISGPTFDRQFLFW